MNWLFFALLSPIFYGVTNFIEKFLIDKKVKDPIIVVAFAGVPAFLVAFFILLINGFPIISFQNLLLIVLSGVFLELYLVPYFMALSVEDASRVVPLFQLIPVFILVFSFLFLGETLNTSQLVGFLFIFVGAIIIGAKREDGKIFRLRKAIYLMLLSGFLFSITAILFKFVVVNESFWETIAYQFLGISLGALLLLTVPKYKERVFHDAKHAGPKIWGLLTLNYMFALIAQASLGFAYLLAPVALVSVIGSTQPLFVLIYGVILSIWFPHIIKEDLQKSTILVKLAAIILIIIGVSIIQSILTNIGL